MTENPPITLPTEMADWRVSIRGTTEYVVVKAMSAGGALSLASILLNRPEDDLEVDRS